MRFMHSLVSPIETIAADGVQSFELGVNPCSHLLLNLRPLNDTGTLANFASYLGICEALVNVSVMWRGETIVSMSGADLAAMNYFRNGMMPPQAMHSNTNDERRFVQLPLLFGRYPWDPSDCWPGSRRGELTLQVNFDVADTGYNGFDFNVEQVELIGAKPKTFERKGVQARTVAAVGQNDFDLPVGRDIRGCLLWGTTGYAGASPAPSWGRLAVLLDNAQHGYSAVDFESLHAFPGLWGRQPPAFDGHDHYQTANTDTVTIGGPVGVGNLWGNYAYLPFDVTNDDTFTLESGKANRVVLRAECETADAVRWIPVEVMPASYITSQQG